MHQSGWTAPLICSTNFPSPRIHLFYQIAKVIRSLVLPRTRLDSGFQSGFEGLDQDHIVCVLPKPNTFSLLLSYLAKGLRRLSPGTRPA